MIAAINYRFGVKIALSALLVALLLFSLLGRDKGFDALFEPIDTRAESYLERAVTNAAITYGTIRGIHAIIAIFKGTQIHPPFATIALGEALDPVQDLIERFSDVLLMAIVSLGAQRFLMEIGQMIGVSLFVSIASLLLLLGLWIHKARERLMMWGARLIVLGLAARLIIPLLAYGAFIVGEVFLESRYSEAQSAIDAQQTEIKLNSLPAVQEEQGFIDKIKGLVSTEAFSRQIEEFKERAENLAKSMITLFTLFVFQTLIFPLISLWILVKLFFGFLPRKS
ncbi:MAG: hypothetical protein LBN32_01360 [Helicobacteraceae bacterium]|jgi:ABC-type multidrug transport system fused ATPase/permease subunit|nr:hypothetical protein [Helicobacteraceae bacterium]